MAISFMLVRVVVFFVCVFFVCVFLCFFLVGGYRLH